MDDKKLEQKIQEAWGYGEYEKRQYDSFSDFYEKHYYLASHESGRDRYASAADRLESLVKKVNKEN